MSEPFKPGGEPVKLNGGSLSEAAGPQLGKLGVGLSAEKTTMAKESPVSGDPLKNSSM